MRVVILGCGRVGAMLAQLLTGEGHDVTVIDQDSNAFRRLGSEFPQSQTVIGDGTDADVLRRAGIEQADAFVATTNGDNRNIMAAQIARHTFDGLGLESICPTIVGAKLFRDALVNPVMRSSSPTASMAQGRSVPLTPVKPAPHQ